MTPHRYFVLNKPYNMVSQFVSPHNVRLLGDLGFDFPEGTHAIGRLDNQSEGLLLLTTNQKITRLLFQGERPHVRTYMVQVKNRVSNENLQKLKNGIGISAKNGGTHFTGVCDVSIMEPPANLFSSGYELREGVENTWLRISLTEGKFHQVRKMVGAIHHKCKRLIRVSIEDLGLDGLLPGEVREVSEEDFFRKLRLTH
ncbi:rRNA pseudouridine synthase [Sediminibacterium roseum]|uniref:Pseudouridine synthase n=1 Tax=Sediminibacterium roseum TaxID=1978412 RepID=A0ABW9ZVG6_9BACT|nr:pseudouridine synthase [Sediminibacterium roseum]NCI51130.1 rRNA pseudouridine synthase [Sediminibacterium roseum]